MKAAEIQIVRRRLDDYQSYKVLLSEADRAALMTQEALYASASPKSPGWSGEHSQNPVLPETRYNRLISDQMAYESDAADYRARMHAIEIFLGQNFSGDTLKIFRLHFLDGMSYEAMEYPLGMSASGLKNSVYRALEKVSFSAAADLI